MGEGSSYLWAPASTDNLGEDPEIALRSPPPNLFLYRLYVCVRWGEWYEFQEYFSGKELLCSQCVMGYNDVLFRTG